VAFTVLYYTTERQMNLGMTSTAQLTALSYQFNMLIQSSISRLHSVIIVTFNWLSALELSLSMVLYMLCYVHVCMAYDVVAHFMSEHYFAQWLYNLLTSKLGLYLMCDRVIYLSTVGFHSWAMRRNAANTVSDKATCLKKDAK